jgi:ATP/maltotriose-dependent transcriptional regulator MalT
MGWPLTELGRIRLRRGDVEGAEQALLAAHAVGWDPQPGLALVRLAQGDVAGAAASIRAALERPVRVPSKELPPDTELQRAPLLEAQVEIEVAAGDLDRARLAADELELVADRFHSKALVAGATVARGRVRLAEGDVTDAQRLFSDAARLWTEVGKRRVRSSIGSKPRRQQPQRPTVRERAKRVRMLRRSPASFGARATTGRWCSRGAR